MRALGMVVVVVSAMAAPARAGGHCTCQNLAEIQYRMKEIRLAIAVYKQEIAQLGANSPPFTKDAYNAEETTVQSYLDTLKANTPGSPLTKGASTDPASCTPDIPKVVSQCLQDALQAHESHHATVCHTIKGNYAGKDPITDYRSGGTLAAAFQQEIDSYYIELDWLSQALRDLPDSCRPNSWYLSWTLTVTGKSSEHSKIKWSVKHEYEGQAELADMGTTTQMPTINLPKGQKMTQQQAIQMAQSLKKVHLWMVKAQAFLPVVVDIDDLVRTKGHDRGEGDSFEDTTKQTTWKVTQVPDTVMAGARLEVDEKGKTYNVTIPVALMGQNKTVDVELTIEIERSPYGFGSNKQTHEGPTTFPQPPVLPSTMKLPDVAEILGAGNIHHAKDQPFAPTQDIIQFDKTFKMDATSTFLAGLPDAAKNVDVHVLYTLSKQRIR